MLADRDHTWKEFCDEYCARCACDVPNEDGETCAVRAALEIAAFVGEGLGALQHVVPMHQLQGKRICLMFRRVGVQPNA